MTLSRAEPYLTEPCLTESWLTQRERTALVCTCEECVHFSPDETCSLGYPTTEHRLPTLAAGSFVFCKSFEAT